MREDDVVALLCDELDDAAIAALLAIVHSKRLIDARSSVTYGVAT